MLLPWLFSSALRLFGSSLFRPGVPPFSSGEEWMEARAHHECAPFADCCTSNNLLCGSLPLPRLVPGTAALFKSSAKSLGSANLTCSLQGSSRLVASSLSNHHNEEEEGEGEMASNNSQWHSDCRYECLCVAQHPSMHLEARFADLPNGQLDWSYELKLTFCGSSSGAHKGA